MVVALSWVRAIALYQVTFFALPEDSELGWIAFIGLTFVFAFAVWGVIDLAIHSNVRLKYAELGKGERYGQPSGDRRAPYNAGSKPASSTS